MHPLILAVLLAEPAAAQIEAPSSVRVSVTSAAVSGLDCRRRPYEWENTRAVAQRYKSVGSQMVTEGWDPRPIAMGVFASVLMAPVMAAAVPADLLSGPFRKTCAFTLRLSGTLDEWAGQRRAGAALVLEGASLSAPEVENVAKARWETFSAQTASGDDGGFSVTLPARMGRAKELALRWRVGGQPAGQLLLQKKGRHFLLSEPDPGFGVGTAEMEPLLIEPAK